MPAGVGLLLVALALVAVKALDVYVSRRRERCSDMLGMMVGMVAGMMTGLVIGEVAGFFTNMFWGNLCGLLIGVSLGGYLGRFGRLLGILDGAMAGIMGGMMGAMLGVMLKFPPEYALATGVILLVAQIVALTAVAYLVRSACPPPAAVPDYYHVLGVGKQATAREIAAAYLTLTEPATAATNQEQKRLTEEALAVLSDPFRRLTYDRLLAAQSVTSPALAQPLPEARSDHDPQPSSPVEASDEGTTLTRRKGWGILGLIAVAVVGFGYVAARPATCPPPVEAVGLPALPEPGTSQKQMVNLTVEFPCYFPDRITIQRGVPVQFNVGAVGEPGCGRALVFQGLGISKYISPGKITTFEFTPEQAGSYSITCTMHMMRAARLDVVD